MKPSNRPALQRTVRRLVTPEVSATFSAKIAMPPAYRRVVEVMERADCFGTPNSRLHPEVRPASPADMAAHQQTRLDALSVAKTLRGIPEVMEARHNRAGLPG
jgi:hypothetical protein